jgi:transmembrane sensor
MQMETGQIAQDPNEAALEQAAEWLVRLNDAAVTEADFLAWQSWLTQSPTHALAFQQMQDTWRRSASVSQLPIGDAKSLHSMREQSLAGLDASRQRRKLAVRWSAVAAAALVAIVVVFLWRDESTVFQTTTAELRSIRLPDGSRAALGPETQLKLEFSERTRALTMTKGEAYFEVVHSAERPFSIETPAGRVVAVGTAFCVHATDGRVSVSVTQGAVRVEPFASAASAAAIIVEAGHRFVRDRAGTDREEPISAADAMSWQQGRLQYQGEPLRLVIADINRYSPVKMRIADPALGELRYTGTVFPDALDTWIESVEGVFPIRVETVDGQRVLVAAQPARSD